MFVDSTNMMVNISFEEVCHVNNLLVILTIIFVKSTNWFVNVTAGNVFVFFFNFLEKNY